MGKTIFVAFKDLSADTKLDSKIQGVIFQIKDTTLAHKHFIFNYDLSGCLLSIELGDCYRARTIKILERSFNGNVYIYLKNCDNLKDVEAPVNYYYDYYNNIVIKDDHLAKVFIEYAHQLTRDILSGIHKPVYEQHNTNLSAVTIMQDIVQKYSYEALCQNIGFKMAYPKDITVLPPDVRPDLNPSFAVLQMTNGCWVKQIKPCAFCNAYAQVAYNELTDELFSAHIDNVKRYCGRNWLNKNHFFLSDGDPLKTKIKTQVYFNIMHQKIDNIEGIESFVTTSTILSKNITQWQELKDMGLKRLYWGVESADDFVLEILNKPQTNASLYRAAKHLELAKMPYTIIIMSGLGNFEITPEIKNNHVRRTIDFINQTSCDEVYVSKFKSIEGTQIYHNLMTGKLINTKRMDVEDEHRLIISGLNKRVKGSYGAQFI